LAIVWPRGAVAETSALARSGQAHQTAKNTLAWKKRTKLIKTSLFRSG
jgi:hypothetical protein